MIRPWSGCLSVSIARFSTVKVAEIVAPKSVTSAKKAFSTTPVTKNASMPLARLTFVLIVQREAPLSATCAVKDSFIVEKRLSAKALSVYLTTARHACSRDLNCVISVAKGFSLTKKPLCAKISVAKRTTVRTALNRESTGAIFALLVSISTE